MVQCKATQAQLDQALALSEEMDGATSLLSTGKSGAGETLLETLGVPDGGGLGETEVVLARQNPSAVNQSFYYQAA